MAGWLVSVKYAMDKRSEKLGALTGDTITKIFNKATDLTKAFEYLLATGNLQSKTGMKLVLQLAASLQNEVTELMCSHGLLLCLFQFFFFFKANICLFNPRSGLAAEHRTVCRSG